MDLYVRYICLFMSMRCRHYCQDPLSLSLSFTLTLDVNESIHIYIFPSTSMRCHNYQDPLSLLLSSTLSSSTSAVVQLSPHSPSSILPKPTQSTNSVAPPRSSTPHKSQNPPPHSNTPDHNTPYTLSTT